MVETESLRAKEDEMVCDHGDNPRNPRAVTQCYGIRGGGARPDGHDMVRECMLCGAVRTYRVLRYEPASIEYGPWQIEYGPWQNVAAGNE